MQLYQIWFPEANKYFNPKTGRLVKDEEYSFFSEKWLKRYVIEAEKLKEYKDDNIPLHKMEIIKLNLIEMERKTV